MPGGSRPPGLVGMRGGRRNAVCERATQAHRDGGSAVWKMSTPAAGWYPDPTDPGLTRWWNGTAWTGHVLPPPSAAPLAPPPQPAPVATTAPRRGLPLWAWVVLAVIALASGILLSPILAPLFLAVLITGIVALAKSTPTWLRFRSRGTATVVTVISAVGFLVTGSLSSVVLGQQGDDPVAAAPPAAIATPTPTASVDDAEPDAVADDASLGSARQLLATLPVKGRAAKTGYSRDRFGQRWLDVDRNGCDTRNDILAAQLTGITREGRCKVLSGTLADPYTATTIEFVRGQGTSELVQIDHVVALSDAWQKGAQALTADQRAAFANDPLNLLAVDGTANAQKGDGDAATWLPKNRAFRCEYVARQVAVKAAYSLWVTQAEHDAIGRILDGCPDQTAPVSGHTPSAPAVDTTPEPAPVTTPAPVATTTPTSAPTPVPFAPAPAPTTAAPAPAPAPAPPTTVTYANCTAVRDAGAAPIRLGDPGYSTKLDRDGDGVACE